MSLTREVSADGDSIGINITELNRKAYLNHIQACYSNETDFMQPSVSVKDFAGQISNLTKGSGLKVNILKEKRGKLQLTTGNCKDMFSVLIGSSWIFSGDYERIGYKLEGNSNTSNLSIKYKYNYTDSNSNDATDNLSTNTCDIVTNDNGIIESVTCGTVVGTSEIKLTNGGLFDKYVTIGFMKYGPGVEPSEYTSPNVYSVRASYKNKTPEEFKESLESAMDKLLLEANKIFKGYALEEVSISTPETGSFIVKQNDAALIALRNLSGKDDARFDTTPPHFTLQEQYNLYWRAVNQAFADSEGDQGPGVVRSLCSANQNTAVRNSNDNGHGGYVIRTSDGQWCPVKNVEKNNNREKYPVINRSLTGFTEINLATALERLAKDFDEEFYEDGGVSGGIDENGNITGDINTNDNPDANDGGTWVCFTAAKSLGWILCPVLDVTSTVLTGIYNNGVKPLLEKQSSFLTGDNENAGLYKGWKTFRDFANIIFAILFVVVIFAQVTGVGISNYNIKKSLPRLIVVVILVNISFILCQVAVDLSNILGSTFQATFERLAKEVNGGVSWTFVDGVSSIASTALSANATIGILGIGVITWTTWLPIVLLSILTMLISILFFFVIVGIRQAGVIILIAIAPVAIVCYALPNTKSFFDRWYKLFVALLMVYPICGLLMGGGQFASALLVSTGATGDAGFLYMLIAMLVSVLPFFLIPTILKQSLAAAGSLGAKIAGLGNNLSSRATKAVDSSEAMREFKRGLGTRRDINTYRRYQAGANSAKARLDMLNQKVKDKGGDPTKEADLKKYLSKSEYLKYQAQRALLDYSKRRASHALDRSERATMDDIRAGTTRNPIIPGSEAYENAVNAAEAEQEKKAMNELEESYKIGRIQSITGSGEAVNFNDSNSLEQELQAHIATLSDTNATDEQVKNAQRHAMTLSKILSDKKSGGDRRKVIQSLESGVAGNKGVYTSNTAQGARARRAMGEIASRIQNAYGADYKKDAPSSTAVLSDLAAGTLSKYEGMFKVGLNADGKSFRIFDKEGLDGANVEDVSKFKSYETDRIRTAIENSDLSGQELANFAEKAREVLSSGVYTPEDKTADGLYKVLHSAFGTSDGAIAKLITKASQNSPDILFNYAADIAKNYETADDKQKQAYQRFAENVKASLENDFHTIDGADRLNDILTSLGDAGLRDAKGEVIKSNAGNWKLRN